MARCNELGRSIKRALTDDDVMMVDAPTAQPRQGLEEAEHD